MLEGSPKALVCSLLCFPMPHADMQEARQKAVEILVDGARLLPL